MARALRSVPGVEPQQGFDEQVIEDSDLQRALESRQVAKEERSEKQKAYKKAHDVANALIERLELPVGGAARVGRFRITRRSIEGRNVTFETSDSDRVTIALVG